ncbi:SDR family oxidoreductase [Pseudomonas cavernae]|uniref:SDR family oxidoreductase n=1 Tax=Pseudomonas cavernae TaxID=2320867 RepID=A0A385Z1B7_9PSED|nr:SDR family NAD(P)-dependent oxidoreductase [Pseudomonas cavernae]AYC32999.1 SDR family oxidoreductase [Pseudomonas cavernae]
MSKDCKVALITGAASGIGRATAELFSTQGYHVCLLDIQLAPLEALASEIISSGGQALALKTDTTCSADLQYAVAQTLDAWGRLDAVVSAAGIARQGLVTEMSEDGWERMLAVNLTGTFLLARHTIPALLQNGAGSFVAVSSDAGVRGSAGFAAYCASKHGVVGLVRCLALDYGPRGIRSNVVCPGFVETPMADELLAAEGAAEKRFYESQVPLGRFARADEVAQAILHLSSSQASYTNGMLYVIDGGNTAGTFVAD